MGEPQEARFVCSVCHAAFTQRDIDEGVAVVRHDEVLCIKHFEEKYPGECVNHPGTKATEKCDQCGRMVCKDCIIELGGETACPKCKPVRMAEIVTGRQLEPPEYMEKPRATPERTKEFLEHLARGEIDSTEDERIRCKECNRMMPSAHQVIPYWKMRNIFVGRARWYAKIVCASCLKQNLKDNYMLGIVGSCTVTVVMLIVCIFVAEPSVGLILLFAVGGGVLIAFSVAGYRYACRIDREKWPWDRE